MSNDAPPAEAATEEEDHWPAFDITPKAYEEAVAAIAKSMNLDITGWHVQHLESIQAPDGAYIMDVTARFQMAGMDFLILFECKRHKTRVKRSDVQVLHTKLQSIGAQKGVVVSAAGFQRGALEFAEAHGIACVRLVDNAWTYLTRHTTITAPTALTGSFTGYVITPDDEDYEFALLTGNADNTRAALMPQR
jgi:restriction system protein